MFSNFFQPALALLALSTSVYSQSAPAYAPTPFTLIGTIDAMSLGSGGVLAGGSITVNGLPIVIPQNTLVTLPSVTVAWSEMFTGTTPQLPMFGSVSWEATVYGNRLANGNMVAGLVYIAQEAFQSLQGVITSIDFPSGRFVVNNALTLVLNDPTATYSHAYTDNPLWSVDNFNPSVRSSTGFPLCIPRNSTDSQCPLTNRPLNGKNYATTWTFADPAKLTKGAPDARIMVPLAVGDYITFSGIKTLNAGKSELAVYSLEANLGIYTTPGTKPAYITVESVNYGVPDPSAAVEVGETRATVFTTDISTTVEWFAMDVDPCTGGVTERQLGPLARGSGTAPFGKIDYRKVAGGTPSRQVGFRYTSYNGINPAPLGPRGTNVGAFVQPVFNFIFPEILNFGAQEFALEFPSMDFLAKGSGPFVPGNPLTPAPATAPIVGQLSPWPGAAAPATVKCVAARDPAKAAAAPAAPAAPAPVAAATTKDTISNVVCSSRNQFGQTTTSCSARSSDPTAQLFMAIQGVDPVAPQTMTKQTDGSFALGVDTKGKPSSATITSNKGATPVTEAV
ncbi:hypothetical protein DFH06DRAFT_1366430 [Mycena polygramma]|nr:hypothetical protein DFH06DRAFT_1366430 [Mycena polygramma]